MPEYQVKATNLDELDTFTRAYLEAAEWSGLDDDASTALELSVDPRWTDESLSQAKSDCEAFQRDNASDLAEWTDEQAGHDFWLTRNRHGAGFWDRGMGESGDRVTDAAHVYGEVPVFFDAETETLELG